MQTIKIKGMSCGHCVGAVTNALSNLEGIQNVVVNLENGVATYDEDKQVSKEEITKTINDIGFEVE